MEVGHYAGILCLPHALVAAKARAPKAPDRSEALAAHEKLHRAFKAQNRHLELLAPVVGAQAPAPGEELAPEVLQAIAATMRGLGARYVRTERTYGDRGTTTVKASADMVVLGACATCGTTSPRIKRALFGVGAHVWVLCTSLDTCMARLRKAKGEAA